MENLSLTSRLAFDLKHLIWKAGVHSLSSSEIKKYYNQLRSQYLNIAGESEFFDVQQELLNWEKRISDLMERHRTFPPSPLCQ